LRVRAEFTVVQEHGRRVATRSMTVLGRPNAGGGDRLGIIASRRFGGAVARNRAKRRVREIFRQQQWADARQTERRTLDLVVIPKRELLTSPMSAVESDFVSAIRRLRGAK
jgi:ribonuclease P protein component